MRNLLPRPEFLTQLFQARKELQKLVAFRKPRYLVSVSNSRHPTRLKLASVLGLFFSFCACVRAPPPPLSRNFFSQPYFDVSTSVVLDRVSCSLVPVPRARLVCKFLFSKLRVPWSASRAGFAFSRMGDSSAGGLPGAEGGGASAAGDSSSGGLVWSSPDLYGPFWIATTLVLLLFLAPNLPLLFYTPAPPAAEPGPAAAAAAAAAASLDLSYIVYAAAFAYTSWICPPLGAKLVLVFADYFDPPAAGGGAGVEYDQAQLSSFNHQTATDGAPAPGTASGPAASILAFVTTLFTSASAKRLPLLPLLALWGYSLAPLGAAAIVVAICHAASAAAAATAAALLATVAAAAASVVYTVSSLLYESTLPGALNPTPLKLLLAFLAVVHPVIFLLFRLLFV
eukprot:GHVT01079589.1.p1 GENE.GHVT01079589.1~~GHVT01079589.1.p1  ORF type:complete len:397 (-),score=113.64 GHVT01079589.1:137-1327(-)